MIDSGARSQLAETARALVAGRITNDEFERRVPSSTDPAIREIFDKGFWSQYGDLTEHRLVGDEKWVGEKREFAIRCILFLKSNLTYSWPAHSRLDTFWHFLANILTLGTFGRLARQRLEAIGDTDAWPFRTQTEYLAAVGSPPYLRGLGPNNSFGLTQTLGVHGEIMSNSDKEKLINCYLVAYNSFDIDGMLALLSPDVRFENYSGGQLTDATNGIDEFRQLAEKSKSLFSEREQRITRLTLNPGSAIADIAYRGKLAADIPDGPPAGTVLDLQGQSEFSFKGEQISKIVDRS